MSSSDEHAELAEFLRRLREALKLRGMSQSDLARDLGVRAATVSDWFNQDRVPNGLVMLRLPGILRVSSGWLFSGVGPVDPVRPADEPSEHRGSDAVIGELRALLDELQDQVGPGDEPGPDHPAP